jgi:hypothetical protein
MDSAHPKRTEAICRSRTGIADYRTAVAKRVHVRVGDIDQGRVGTRNQLRVVGQHLLVALINHEYQHDQWISEVRHRDLGHDLPAHPVSERLTEIDGFTVVVT